MRFLDGQLVVFMGDSITQYLVAVNDWMETQTDGLPPVGTRVCIDRHENRGWTEILANRIHLAYPERQIRYLNAGIGGHSSRQMLARRATPVSSPFFSHAMVRWSQSVQWSLLYVG